MQFHNGIRGSHLRDGRRGGFLLFARLDHFVLEGKRESCIARRFCFVSRVLVMFFSFVSQLSSSGSVEKKVGAEGGEKSRPGVLGEITQKKSIDVDIFAKDWRNYNCKTWHLEPTVRLLSVAGKYIEPYGIDYILQKLGFAHARTTIPKWMQRGFMDPLDAILAVLTLRMVQVIKGDGNKSEKEKIEAKK